MRRHSVPFPPTLPQPRGSSACSADRQARFLRTDPVHSSSHTLKKKYIYSFFIWVRSCQRTGLAETGLILRISWCHSDTGILVTGTILIPCLTGIPRGTGTILNIPRLCAGSIMEPGRSGFWSIFHTGSIGPIHHMQHRSHVRDRPDCYHALRFHHPHPAAQLVPGPAERFCRFSL